MLQKETFYSVMQCMNVLKAGDWDNLYEDGSGLNLKEAYTLNKYITRAFELLVAKDQSKFAINHSTRSLYQT